MGHTLLREKERERDTRVLAMTSNEWIEEGRGAGDERKTEDRGEEEIFTLVPLSKGS